MRLFNIWLVLIMMLPGMAACSTANAPETHAASLRFPGLAVELPTKAIGAHRLVEGTIGGPGPVNLIVDTGSSVNVLDKGIAQKLDLQPVRQMKVLSGGTEPVTADVVRVPEMQVGDLTIRNAEFLLVDLDKMSMGSMQAVLGMQLFSGHLLTLDPGHDEIRISRGHLSEGATGVLLLKGPVGQIMVTGEVAGKPADLNFDTGSPDGFTFPASMEERVPLASALQSSGEVHLVGGGRSVKTGRLAGDIKLAGMTYVNPAISFINPGPPHINIGNRVLKDLVMVIDQQNRLIALQRAHASGPTMMQVKKPASSPAGRGRLGIRFRGFSGEGLSEVAGVDEGSLADRSGIQAGDRITSLNGKPMSAYGVQGLGTVLRGPDPLVFVVQRADGPHTITIP